MTAIGMEEPGKSMNIRPSLVLPLHDPAGVLLDQLGRITPTLREQFSHAFVSLSPVTVERHAERLAPLEGDPFFVCNHNAPGTLPGDHYRAAYQSAISHCPSEQQLHLCDLDKLAAIVQSHYRAPYLADIAALARVAEPVLFQRSAAAWATYPQPYREIEHLAIRLGEYLFARTYDWAWSYLVIRAGDLAAILPQLAQRSFGLLAEIVLLLRDRLEMQPVDWLFWEDPFIEGRDPAELRHAREASREETEKRLRANVPILRLLLDHIEQVT
jgi:hypothetical protein